MIRAAPRIAAVVLLLALAGASGYAAYGDFSDRSPPTDGWAQAAAAARQAELTKAQLPALRKRDHAIQLFTTLADSGPRNVRSRAAMLAGLLLLGKANTDPAQSQGLLTESASSLRRAVRLDRSNDDAAFDLELLLSRAKASGRPIAQVPHMPRKHHGRPTSGKPGSGY